MYWKYESRLVLVQEIRMDDVLSNIVERSIGPRPSLYPDSSFLAETS